MTGYSHSEIAREILGKNPVYLDTETTGLGPTDQICEISIVDNNGSVLLDTLVRPTIPMKSNAQQVHGISDEMLQDAPYFSEILPEIRSILNDRVLVIYNSEYDLRMMGQSAYAMSIPLDVNFNFVYCAMELYALYWGDWSDYFHSYKWQRLGDAMIQQGIKYEGQLHRALADCQVTRLLMHKMAGVQ